MLLIALPILVFASVFLNLLGAKRFVERKLTDWRTAFLMASLVWAIYVFTFSYENFNSSNQGPSLMLSGWGLGCWTPLFACKAPGAIQAV